MKIATPNFHRCFLTVLVVLPLYSPLRAQETDEDGQFHLGFTGSAVFPYDPKGQSGPAVRGSILKLEPVLQRPSATLSKKASRPEMEWGYHHTSCQPRRARVGSVWETPTRLLVQSRKARQECIDPSDRRPIRSSHGRGIRQVRLRSGQRNVQRQRRWGMARPKRTRNLCIWRQVQTHRTRGPQGKAWDVGSCQRLRPKDMAAQERNEGLIPVRGTACALSSRRAGSYR